MNPEQRARQEIDRLLEAAGWDVQDPGFPRLFAQKGVAIREPHLTTGYADYLLMVDGKAVGVIEAKKQGHTLSGVIHQAEQYAIGLQQHMQAWLPQRQLPFSYVSTGVETMFRNDLDPRPRSRRVFAFHQPETVAEWLEDFHAGRGTLRSRLERLPEEHPLEDDKLWDPQVKAIRNLEQSLAQNRPRALIQMATGSGKTFTTVSAVYRLVKFAGARRILFLVDRRNLGRQALKEFQSYVTPDDGRKFTELYNVQLLRSNVIDDDAKVVISTIQRVYSTLRADEELDEETEERSMWDAEEAGELDRDPKRVTYTESIPIEKFDFIITDECHRSIYNLWRQVLEYFDAFLIGLTATPTKQTIGFFDENMVMEYTHQDAVADGINVNGDVYRIQTRLSGAGSTVEAGYHVGELDRRTREMIQRQLDEDFTYQGTRLGRDVIAPSQIRLVIKTFKEKLFTELFPGREHVPKTLIFAKDDNHAEEIVRIVREEFAQGDEFCQKVTYLVTGKKPEEIIADFRNRYYPRVAVTVDMIATGTDVKPIEILLFLRNVKSLGYFEQMRGRGVRVIQKEDLQAVSSDAGVKDRFLIVDAAGVTMREKIDVTRSLNRKPHVPLPDLLQQMSYGQTGAEIVATVAGRLARLGQKMTDADRETIREESGQSLSGLTRALLDTLDTDQTIASIRAEKGETYEPDEAEIEDRAARRRTAAVQALQPLFPLLAEIHKRSIVTYDEVSQDRLMEAVYDEEATYRARQTITSFREFIEENKDEIAALRLIYGEPSRRQPLTFAMVQELAEKLKEPPHQWTTRRLWGAYQKLEQDSVRGAPAQRRLADLIALIRHVVNPDDGELAPYDQLVRQRYEAWLAQQEAAGRHFTPEQRWWLDRIAEHIGVNLAIELRDSDSERFIRKGEGLVLCVTWERIGYKLSKT